MSVPEKMTLVHHLRGVQILRDHMSAEDCLVVGPATH